MDYILIEGLTARCILGVGEEERRERQEVLIDIELGHNSREAGRSDNFDDAVDYRALKKRVLALAEGSQYYLVEALAEAIAGLCLEHPKVRKAVVTVRKPSALRFARSVGIRISRRRKP